MAEDTKTNKKIDEMYDRLVRQTQAQEKASAKLTDAIDELGEKAISALTKNIKDAAKATGFLTDEQLDQIQSSKDLIDVIKEQEERLEDLSNVAKKRYKDEVEAIKAMAGFEKFSKAAQEKILADSKKTHELEMQRIEELKASQAAFNKQSDQLIGSAQALDKFTNFVGRGSKALAGWAAKTFTASKAIDDLKDAAVQAIGELGKATAVGLQDSLFTISMSAMHLNMSFDEFSDVISKNRDIVRQLGGGTVGIKNFTEQLEVASKGLEFMGRDGTFATARFTESLKLSGTKMGSKGFNNSIKNMQTHFTEFAAMYGDNAETYADLIETQLKSETIQSRLNKLDDAGKLKLQEEIIARTENIKSMGLSNEQIKIFNDKVSELYDPHKTNIEEKITGAEMTKSWLQQLATQSGDEALKGALPKLNEFLEFTKRASDEQIKTRAAELAPEMELVGAAQAQLTKNQEAMAISADTSQSQMAATSQLTSNILREAGGGTAALFASQGTSLYQAKSQGLQHTNEQDLIAKKTAADQVNGEVDLYTKTIKIARDVQQEYNAIMQNSVVKGAIGLAEGLGAAITSLGKFGKMLEMVGKGGGGSTIGGFFKSAPKVGPLGSFGTAAAGTGASALTLGAAGVAGMLYSSSTAGPELDEIPQEWKNNALAAKTNPSALNLPNGDYRTSAAAANPIETASSAAAGETNTDSLEELKKQTKILVSIAQNTTSSYRPVADPRGFKSSPAQVANNIK